MNVMLFFVCNFTWYFISLYLFLIACIFYTLFFDRFSFSALKISTIRHSSSQRKKKTVREIKKQFGNEKLAINDNSYMRSYKKSRSALWKSSHCLFTVYNNPISSNHFPLYSSVTGGRRSFFSIEHIWQTILRRSISGGLLLSQHLVTAFLHATKKILKS